MPFIQQPLTDNELDRILQDDPDVHKTLQKILERKTKATLQDLSGTCPTINISKNEFDNIKVYLNTNEVLPELSDLMKNLLVDISNDDKSAFCKKMVLIVKVLKKNLGL